MGFQLVVQPGVKSSTVQGRKEAAEQQNSSIAGLLLYILCSQLCQWVPSRSERAFLCYVLLHLGRRDQYVFEEAGWGRGAVLLPAPRAEWSSVLCSCRRPLGHDSPAAGWVYKRLQDESSPVCRSRDPLPATLGQKRGLSRGSSYQRGRGPGRLLRRRDGERVTV